MNPQIDGYLGTALGATVGALMAAGHTPQEIHGWVDMAIRAREFAPEDPRWKEAAELITASAKEMTDG